MAQIYGVFRLVWLHCGGQTRIIARIIDALGVGKILENSTRCFSMNLLTPIKWERIIWTSVAAILLVIDPA